MRGKLYRFDGIYPSKVIFKAADYYFLLILHVFLLVLYLFKMFTIVLPPPHEADTYSKYSAVNYCCFGIPNKAVLVGVS